MPLCFLINSLKEAIDHLSFAVAEMAKLGGTLAEKLWWLYSYVEQELTWQAVCVYGIILLLSWLVTKLFIFPTISPLRKIPGRPVTWRNILLGHLLEIFSKEAIDPYYEWVCEMKTGIIRYRHLLGSQRVLVADADVVKDIMVTNARYYPRPVFLFGFFYRVVGKSLLTLEGHEHSVQRRLCNTAFKQSFIQGLLPKFQQHCEHLCQKWTSAIKTNTEGPTVVDIQSSISNMTFDVICDAGFGYQSNSQHDTEEKMYSAFNYLLTGGRNRLLRMMMPKLSALVPSESNRKFQASLSLLHSIITHIVSKKKKAMADGDAGKTSEMDLLEVLLSASDVESGVGLPQEQLQDHIMTFMLAGHETTASSISWTLLALARNPDIQTKARQEALSHLPRFGQPVTIEVLDQMTYINCVIKEGLRMYPPAPIIMREATQDMMLGGYEIPKGTIISISIGALHRNPAYWEDPETFKPERFLDESAVPFYAFQPFMSGPHMCIGYKFALQELRLFLALLLQRFEFSPLPGVTYQKKQLITMRPFPPLKLNIRCVA